MDDEKPEIAIIGAGPIGLEAALYARYLGYPVSIYEWGEICNHVSKWGHVQMFSPFAMNSSSLGRSALQAQFPELAFPELDQLHTGQEWVTKYLEPLAKSDLIRKSLRLNTRVLAIGRDTFEIDDENDRSNAAFRLLTEGADGKQSYASAEIVIDATGTLGQSNGVGIGGMPVPGFNKSDVPVSNLFTQQIPELSQLETSNKTDFLVLGRGFSAATNIVQVEKLHQANSAIRCIWVTRGAAQAGGPMKSQPNDPLAYRAKLANHANQLATKSDWLDWKTGQEIESIRFVGGRFHVRMSDQTSIEVDHIIANTGFHGDYEMLASLHIHRCYVSGGPMAWAASVANSSDDCLQQKCTGPDAVKTTESDFYIIGSKSYGTDPRFLFSTGLQQVRDVFKLIQDRDSLDLYSTMDAIAGQSH